MQKRGAIASKCARGSCSPRSSVISAQLLASLTTQAQCQRCSEQLHHPCLSVAYHGNLAKMPCALLMPRSANNQAPGCWQQGRPQGAPPRLARRDRPRLLLRVLPRLPGHGVPQSRQALIATRDSRGYLPTVCSTCMQLRAHLYGGLQDSRARKPGIV